MATFCNEEIMEIETDIKLIELLSQQREDANWAFRCFLKELTLSFCYLLWFFCLTWYTPPSFLNFNTVKAIWQTSIVVE
jgi:hypothetical protein